MLDDLDLTRLDRGSYRGDVTYEGLDGAMSLLSFLGI